MREYGTGRLDQPNDEVRTACIDGSLGSRVEARLYVAFSDTTSVPADDPSVCAGSSSFY